MRTTLRAHRPFFFLIAAAAMSTPLAQAGPRAMNDSGQLHCRADNGRPSRDCAGSGQDAEFGRDVSVPDRRDGKGGFSFARVCNSGEIAGEGSCPAEPERGAAPTEWGCTLDRVTGLVWELKTEGGLRDANLRYSNFGYADSSRDAAGYAAMVNAVGLCGHVDWRLPTRMELIDLLDLGKPAPGPTIDGRWLPNTARALHWTGTPYVGDARLMWSVNFEDGSADNTFRQDPAAVRLVRGDRPEPPAKRFIVREQQVLDRSTGLVWRRCSEGQQFEAGACVGIRKVYDWKGALAHAREFAQAKGEPWRLPTAKELATLVDDTRFLPAIDPVVFPDTPYEGHLSSTHVTGTTKEAWGIGFTSGDLYGYPGQYNHVIRLVRDAR